MASIEFVKKLPEYEEFRHQYRVFMRDMMGSRKTKMIYVDSKRQAQQMADLLERKLRETGTVDGLVLTRSEKMNMTIEQLAERYLEEVQSSKEAKTYQNYYNHINNNIIPYFGEVKVSSIDVMAINAFRTFLKTPGARVNKTKKTPYASSTVKDILYALKGMLNTAKDWGIIDVNPMENYKIPRVKSAEANWYNKEQLALLLKKLNAYIDYEMEIIDKKEKSGRFQQSTIAKERVAVFKYKLIIYLAVLTGARRGEIIGLHRSDIDLVRKRIEIKHEVLYTSLDKIYMSDYTKTKEDRVVGINEKLIPIIEEYYKLIDELFDCPDITIEKPDLLFISLRNTKNAKFGGLLFPDPISNWFVEFLEKNDLPRISFHKLRHSALSHMLEMGVNPTEVAKIAGHGVQTLLNTYTHTDEEVVLSKAQVYDALLETVENEVES